MVINEFVLYIHILCVFEGLPCVVCTCVHMCVCLLITSGMMWYGMDPI